MASRVRAYYCIGGPLDGQFASSIDFFGDWVNHVSDEKPHHEKGMYEHLREEYVQFNKGERSKKGIASMVWIHISLLKPPINASKR